MKQFHSYIICKYSTNGVWNLIRQSIYEFLPILKEELLREEDGVLLISLTETTYKYNIIKNIIKLTEERNKNKSPLTITRTTITNHYHNRNQLNYYIVNNLQYQHQKSEKPQSAFIICNLTTEYYSHNNKLFIMMTFVC